MKNRIIALVLVVVMSLLALSSCGCYDFAGEDLSAYTEFKYADFKKALEAIEIEDGDFTTDEATRLKITAAKIYSAVVDKIVAATEEDERNTTFEEALGLGDVLYFVYYAVGKDAEGNEYRFDSAHMDVSYITNTTYKAQHVVKLDNYYYSEADTLLGLIKDAVLANLDNLNPYATKTKAQLEADFVEEWEEANEGKTYSEVLKAKEDAHKKAHEDANTTCADGCEDLKAINAFKDEYTKAKEAAIKVHEGGVYFVSYTRTYEKYQKGKGEITANEDGTYVDEDGKKTDAEGYLLDDSEGGGNRVTTTVTEKAAYEELDPLSMSNPLHAVLLDERVTAKVGDTAFKAYLSTKEDGTFNTSSSFPVTDEGAPAEVKDGKYTYSSFAIKWAVAEDEEGRPIKGTAIPVTHTPETKKDNTTTDDKGVETTKKVEKTPDNLTISGKKVDIVGMELTYYVFPVYAIEAKETKDITAYDILYYIYGSKLDATDLEVLAEDYKNGDDTLEDLLKEIADMYDTKSTTNDYFKKDGILYELNKAYNDAVTAGGSKPTDAQQAKIDETKKALNDKQDELLKAVIEKIVALKNGDKTLGDEVFKYNEGETDPTKVYTGEYYKNNYHSLKESYDSDIVKKVQTKVWELIDTMVTVKVDGIPADLVKDYMDHLYESYEYDFYKGNYVDSSSSSSTSTATTSNYDHYKTDGVTEKQAYNNYLYDVLLKDTEYETVDEAIKAEAQKYLVPIIKIFVVSKACEEDALKVYENYVKADYEGGAYYVDKEYYEELYSGDAKKAEKKYQEALDNAKENYENSLKEAKMFLINDAFMKNYKKEVGRVNYNSAIDSYGEINLRTGFQFNKLFYYLTSTDIVRPEGEDHTEVVYTEDGKLSFRTVKYSIIVEADETEGETDTDTDNGGEQ